MCMNLRNQYHYFKELCTFLRVVRAKRIYLIHEPYRERETRQFAEKLSNQGFSPMVAHDFRLKGKNAVKEAIEKSDFTLVLAFDEETVQKASSTSAVVFINLRGNLEGCFSCGK